MSKSNNDLIRCLTATKTPASISGEISGAKYLNNDFYPSEGVKTPLKLRTLFIKTEANLKKILNTVPAKCHLKVDTCNDFVLPKFWGFKDRVNSNFHIAFIRKGSGSYYFGDEKIDMDKGRLFFISSGFKHSRTLELKDIPTIALLRFDIYDNKTLQPAKRDFEPFAFSYIPKNIDRYNELITILIRKYKSSSNEFNSIFCGSILTEIILEIYNEVLFLNDSGNAIDPRLKKAMNYARDNICRELLIDKMVEISGLSKNHFRNLFKKNVGITPKAYIINEKMKEAKIVLAESDCSIKQIAEMLGYPDQYSFSKQFKSAIGYAPSIYHKHLG